VSGIWGDLLLRLAHGSGDDPQLALNAAASLLGLRDKPSATHAGAMVSCYLDQSLPSTLDLLAKFAPRRADVWPALLANANAGGENVHRGAILGCALGAAAGERALPAELMSGLAANAELRAEIDAFVASVSRRP
jgi:ADP-ribosylglycohydrolase